MGSLTNGMITIRVGDPVIDIKLPTLDGGMFDLRSMSDVPFMITFFRFASCPFCNLRIKDLIKLHDEMKGEFNHIAIFESPLKTMQSHKMRLVAPFPVLSDPERVYYKKYGVRRSVGGMIKGMTLRSPRLFKGMLMGNLPTEISSSYLTMPANFLIDENGIIQFVHYGRDEGDHMPIHKVKDFFSAFSEK